MKQHIINMIIQHLLTSLSTVDFKRVIDALLDILEGDNNVHQKAWHKTIRALLDVPDND